MRLGILGGGDLVAWWGFPALYSLLVDASPVLLLSLLFIYRVVGNLYISGAGDLGLCPRFHSLLSPFLFRRVAWVRALVDMSSPRGPKACGGGAVDRQIHVLAVDDSSVDRAVIARLLRSSKYRGRRCPLFQIPSFRSHPRACSDGTRRLLLLWQSRL